MHDTPEHILVRKLVDRYHALRLCSQMPAQRKTLCIECDGEFPDAEVIARATQIMSFRWRVEPNSTSRCIWLTPIFN